MCLLAIGKNYFSKCCGARAPLVSQASLIEGAIIEVKYYISNKMQRQGFSTKNIEYFERDFLDQTGTIEASSLRINSLGNLSLYHLKGMPKFWEIKDSNILNRVMENIVSGFYEGDIPIIFSAFGGKTGLEIIFGTSDIEKSRLDNNSQILNSARAPRNHLPSIFS